MNYDKVFAIVADGLVENFVHGEQQVWILKPLIEHLIDEGWDDFEQTHEKYIPQTYPWIAKALNDVLSGTVAQAEAARVEDEAAFGAAEPADTSTAVASGPEVDVPAVSKSRAAREARVEAARRRRASPRNAG